MPNDERYKVVVQINRSVGNGRCFESLSRSTENKNKLRRAPTRNFCGRRGIDDLCVPTGFNRATKRSIAIMKDLYRPLYLIEKTPIVIKRSSRELLNTRRTLFSPQEDFYNEIANLCAQSAATFTMSRADGMDNRIGRKLLSSGFRFGGSCFPKDTRALTKVPTNRR